MMGVDPTHLHSLQEVVCLEALERREAEEEVRPDIVLEAVFCGLAFRIPGVGVMGSE